VLDLKLVLDLVGLLVEPGELVVDSKLEEIVDLGKGI